MLKALESGALIEFARVGREGTTAVQIVLGLEVSNLALIASSPGEALRMRTVDLFSAMERYPAFSDT